MFSTSALERRTISFDALYQRGEHNRPTAIERHCLVDLRDGRMRLLGRIDKRHAHEPEFLVELGQDRVRECLGSDPGAIGNDEYGRRHRR
jgi:hypothetical protein